MIILAADILSVEKIILVLKIRSIIYKTLFATNFIIQIYLQFASILLVMVKIKIMKILRIQNVRRRGINK